MGIIIHSRKKEGRYLYMPSDISQMYQQAIQSLY